MLIVLCLPKVSCFLLSAGKPLVAEATVRCIGGSVVVHSLLLLQWFVAVLCLVPAMQYLLSFLVLQSSCRGRGSWLIYYKCLPDGL